MPARSLQSLLQDLKRQGLDVIFSSELVSPDTTERQPRPELPPLERARMALAEHGLLLQLIGGNKYVVSALPIVTPEVRELEPMTEISVYASRYAIRGDLSQPQRLSGTDIEAIPGSHDDAIHAVRALPGVVSNASGRPYIRGSLSEDVLVRYDGITLLDPFHLKNFQSLISAIDPEVVDSIEVFSGGFPVQYGRRSGGVIDIAAPSPLGAGYENRASVSLMSGGVSSIGKSESMPMEWIGSLRRSTIDLIEPVHDDFGRPQFSDSLGRLRWFTENGAWTMGWLLLDDRLRLGVEEQDETARARYRDEYVWLTRQHRFSDLLESRSSIVITSADRSRRGQLSRPGIASGELTEIRVFDGVELTSDFTWRQGTRSSFLFGGAFGHTRAGHHYLRISQFSPEVAAAFGRDESERFEYLSQPEVLNLSLYASNRRRWSDLEAEVGVRVDAQRYEDYGNHTQVSPRVNLRYDLARNWRVYASAGRFTQPQHVEEWRAEEAQQRPDAAQVSMHSVLGMEFELTGGAQLGAEAYAKRWTTAAPYFDNALDNFSLLPDLAPDRVRIAPRAAEASGLEIRARLPLGGGFTSWGTLAWSRVADDFGGEADVYRSWDQPLSLTAGLSWRRSRWMFSALGAWHRGWPRTPVDFAPVRTSSRNTSRWGDFYSLDLRGSWTREVSRGEFSVVLDVTNSTNSRNECCLLLDAAPDSSIGGTVDHWLPFLFNLGFTYRWQSPQ